ncbi:sugar phosphate nucleotidyltransferase [Brevibacillus ginsengisoli]|uniref:sugar phosphate nucleotidyltransferase n=1 Tax=Brevibacillus ginsengisoli TaxID=363854 RepID=UPI003CF9AA1E
MKLVLLSGGSGKRLWPLSNDARSKQFLKVLPNSYNQLESMIQRLWGQIRAGGFREAVYISTNQTQVEVIQSQIGSDIPIIIEPERRDTFPAIALATAYLHTVAGIELNEVIAVMPVDPYVEDDFLANIQQLEQALQQSGAQIGLLGVMPTYPSTQYGYIISHPDDQERIESSYYQQVKTFAEKPTEERAIELIGQKALWNCGVFAFKLGYMIDQLKKRGWPTDYYELVKNYGQLPKISFDYEIVEQEEHVIVIPYAGEWKDLGTWNTLTSNLSDNVMGKGMLSKSCKNTHVLNELELPVVVVGLSNVVVAASADGILVADKSSSQEVKELLKNTSEPPMFVERRWGWYRILERKRSTDGIEGITRRVCLLAGKNLSYHYHHHRKEIWVVLAGEGEYILNDVRSPIRVGDALEIPAGAKHGILAITDLEMIEIQLGSKLEEETDTIPIALTWEDALRTINRRNDQ